MLAAVSVVVLLAIVAAALVFFQADDDAAPVGAPAASTGPDGVDEREAEARDQLDALATAWHRHDRQAFVDVGAEPGWGARTWSALTALDVDRFALRYVGADVPRAGSGVDSTAVVDATWRLPGWDEPVSSQLLVDFVDDGIATMRPLLGAPVPLWAVGAVRSVDVGGGATVLLLPGTSPHVRGSVTRQVELARARVEDLLPGTLDRAHPLLVVTPARSAQFAAVLGSPNGWDAIAAVATTVDGSATETVPDLVVLNPTVYGRLGPMGAQVVLAHEATHIATGAAASGAPAWVVEGFADLVALRGLGVPLRTAAGRTLATVRRDGPPRHLPGYAEFRTEAHGLGRAYEQAWLACRMLEQQYGLAATVRFAREVTDGRSLQLALRDELGTDLETVTADWRAELSRLSRVVD